MYSNFYIGGPGLTNKFRFMKKSYKYALIGLITGIVNGLFGSGGGIIVVSALVLLLGEEEHIAHATAISIILPLTIISSFFYISNNYINWDLIFRVIWGGILGGYIGAKLLNFFPTFILRKIFAVFIMVGAIRMIL